MGDLRFTHASAWSERLRRMGFSSLLDVGCGRGELIDFADTMGWFVRGWEVVDYLCEKPKVCLLSEGAHHLPEEDSSWDAVFCLDVMEHLLEDDVPAVLAELWRVTRFRLCLTVAMFESVYHITVKPKEWWVDRFKGLDFRAICIGAGWDQRVPTISVELVKAESHHRSVFDSSSMTCRESFGIPEPSDSDTMLLCEDDPGSTGEQHEPRSSRDSCLPLRTPGP